MPGLRPCLEPGCPELCPAGVSRCVPHQAARDQKRDQIRGTARSRGYDAAWDKLSREWRRRFPVCGQRIDGHRYADHSRCTRDSRIVAAECVDHIVPIKAGGARLDPRNLQSLCLACNSRKAIDFEGGFGRNSGP